jgi:hypothetical protein
VRGHHGASPSAVRPDSLGPAVRALARIAAGRDPLSAAAGEPSPPIQPTTKES